LWSPHPAWRQELEEKLDTELIYAAGAIPPGTDLLDSGAVKNVIQGAGFELTNLLDESTAANEVLQMKNGAVVDIGGGSTELIAGRAGTAPVAAQSFNVGCRRLTERFLSDDPPAPAALAEAREWARATMAPYFGALAEGGFSIDRVVAVAGTATSVVAIREALAVYDLSRVHGAVVTAEELRAIERELAGETLEERERTVGLDPKRAGVIVAGLVILEEVLALAGADAYTASESDILRGMIWEAASVA